MSELKKYQKRIYWKFYLYLKVVLQKLLKKTRTSSKKTLKALMGLNKLTFKEALAFVTEHPECLIRAIIIGKNKMLVGYNEVEMRKFIPRYLRD